MVHRDIERELLSSFQEKEYAHAYAEDFQNGLIATQLKVLREDQHLTQQQLAELADMKQSRISLMEDVNYGSWNLKTLRRLAEALDVALVVRFESFSTLIRQIASFSRESLRQPTRTADLAARTAVETFLDTTSQTALAALAGGAHQTPTSALSAAGLGEVQGRLSAASALAEPPISSSITNASDRWVTKVSHSDAQGALV